MDITLLNGLIWSLYVKNKFVFDENLFYKELKPEFSNITKKEIEDRLSDMLYALEDEQTKVKFYYSNLDTDLLIHNVAF
jgi:hypothetical protein